VVLKYLLILESANEESRDEEDDSDNLFVAGEVKLVTIHRTLQ